MVAVSDSDAARGYDSNGIANTGSSTYRVTDYDACHCAEGFTKLLSGPPGHGTPALAIPHPPPLPAPAASARTHGPKLKTPLPREGPRAFRRVTHAR